MSNIIKGPVPSMDDWLKEAKASSVGEEVGMFLVHNAVIRESSKSKVRFGTDEKRKIAGMDVYFDFSKAETGIEETLKMSGIYYVKVWLNEGRLNIGDDIMYVMVGGDIRPKVIGGLEFLIGFLKEECSSVTEVFE